MILCLYLVFLVFAIVAICCGNFWYAESDAFRELKADHPKVTELLKTKRNIYAKSVFTVMENGTRHDYCLNTNVLHNYEFSKCAK